MFNILKYVLLLGLNILFLINYSHLSNLLKTQWRLSINNIKLDASLGLLYDVDLHK